MKEWLLYGTVYVGHHIEVVIQQNFKKLIFCIHITLQPDHIYYMWSSSRCLRIMARVVQLHQFENLRYKAAMYNFVLCKISFWNENLKINTLVPRTALPNIHCQYSSFTISSTLKNNLILQSIFTMKNLPDLLQWAVVLSRLYQNVQRRFFSGFFCLSFTLDSKKPIPHFTKARA